jgi:hypothetical protein
MAYRLRSGGGGGGACVCVGGGRVKGLNGAVNLPPKLRKDTSRTFYLGLRVGLRNKYSYCGGAGYSNII